MEDRKCGKNDKLGKNFSEENQEPAHVIDNLDKSRLLIISGVHILSYPQSVGK
jgi:hypothetical protein